MKTCIAIILFLLLLPLFSLAQQNPVRTGFWRLASYNGELKLNGFYRDQKRTGIFIKERQNTLQYNGGIQLNTRSYFWHPRFITLDLNGEYAPARNQDKFLAIPDLNENIDIRKLDARISILPQSKFSWVSYYNYGRIYNSRENLSSIRSTGDNWGSTIFIRSGKFPVSLGYTDWKQKEEEILTGRIFDNQQKVADMRLSMTFGKHDKHDILASRGEYMRRDYSGSQVRNELWNSSYSGLQFGGKKQQHTYSTYISGTRQKGFENFDRYQGLANLNWYLGGHFYFGQNYMLFGEQRPQSSLQQQQYGVFLRHQLFQSLSSRIGADQTRTNQSSYDQQLTRGTAELSYTKVIRKKHGIDLSYRYTLQQENWNSQDQTIFIPNEAVNLRDGQITLLARPYIDLPSFRLKDATGTTIYQINLDYILIPQGDFLQVQRVPGGLIPDNANVFAEYRAIQPGNYRYNSTNITYNAGLNFFNRLLQVYYRRAEQDYKQLKLTSGLTLNYFTQQVAGIRLEHKGLGGGVEYDNMKSTVLPYEVYRFFIAFQRTFSNKFVFNINGNYSDYRRLNELKNVRFADLSGTAIYRFTPKISFTTTAILRVQEGQGVNLNMFTSRNELSAQLHKIRFAAIYNYYDRKIDVEQIRFNAVTLQVSRKF